MAEGAGMVVLATESTARRLGLPIQAELAGWALNSDGYHMAMPSGEKIAKCLATALDACGGPARGGRLLQRPRDQHAGQRPGRDARRSRTSSATTPGGCRSARSRGRSGHGLGAASAIEAAVCVRALREQVIPPTINYRPDPELDLDYVPDQARPAAVNTVLSASFGFGGTNNALILTRGDR